MACDQVEKECKYAGLNDGTCQPVSCSSSSDCNNNYVCTNSVCSPCEDNSDCGSNNCMSDNPSIKEEIPYGTCYASECSTDSDC